MDAKCTFFVKSKHATCGAEAKPGTNLCATHQPQADVDDPAFDKHTRCACPVDVNHSIYRANLWSHLARCSRIRDACTEALLPFYARNVNLGYSTEVAPSFKLDLATATQLAVRETSIKKIVEGIMPPWLNHATSKKPTPLITLTDEELESLARDKIPKLRPHWITETDYCDLVSAEGLLCAKAIWAEDEKAKELADRVVEVICSQYNTKERAWKTVEELLDEPVKFKHEIQGFEMLTRMRQFVGAAAFTESLIAGDWVELGAGKGGLLRLAIQFNRVLAQLTHEAKRPRADQARFFLVERERRLLAKEKKGAGGYVEEELSNLSTRLQLDLSDFDVARCVSGAVAPNDFKTGIPWPVQLLIALKSASLEKAEDVRPLLERYADKRRLQVLQPTALPRTSPIVLTGKHLCGPATDLACAIFANACAAHPDRAAYLVIAPCCHHNCRSQVTVGWAQLVEALGRPENEVASMIGWATNGKDPKRLLGRAMRDVVQEHRAAWLKIHVPGCSVRLERYCPTSITMENTLLMARRVPQSNY